MIKMEDFQDKKEVDNEVPEGKRLLQKTYFFTCRSQ